MCSAVPIEKSFFPWYCAHLFVTFAPRKLLTFDNTNRKKFFPWYCAHLFVTFAPRKLLTFDN